MCSVFLSSEAAEEVQPSSHVTSSVKTMTKTPAGAPRQGNGVPPPAAKSWHSGSAAGEMFTRSASEQMQFVCVYSLKRFSHNKHSVTVYMLSEGKRILSKKYTE